MKKIIFFFSFIFSLNLISENLFKVLIKPENFKDALIYIQESHFDLAGADHQTGKIEIILNETQLPLIYKIKGNIEAIQSFNEDILRSGIQEYTSPEEMEEFLFNMASLYPDLMELVLLRNDLFEGHNLWAVKITSSKNNKIKPVFLMDGQHHAREVMTAEITKDAIEYLLKNYGKDEKVTKWIDEIEIWIVPVVNPDGASFVFRQNPWWRKNRHPICPVDINRNYPLTWNKCKGSSGNCFAEDYRGEEPASEPETKGIISLMYLLKPQFYLTYHSYGQYIIYPYGCDYSPEDDTFYEISQELNKILEDDNGKTGKYRVGTSFNTLYITDGTADDEPYGKLGTFSFTIEVNSDRSGGFQPNYSQWRDITVKRQRTAWGFFLDQILYGPQVRGYVYDLLTGKPLEDVEFIVEGIEWNVFEEPRKTDKNGRFFFIARKNKNYNFKFKKNGYYDYDVSVEVKEGPVDLNISMLRIPVLIENKEKFLK